MATKLQRISELMGQTVTGITDKPRAWADFLTTASRLYKYPFDEQILIYAQRPDATACASIEFWNKHMRRWVNRGAKGIALIDDSSARLTLRHVFDVSDTHSLERTPFRLWQMNKSYQEQVIEELSHQFGDADETTTGFHNQLKDIIRNAIQDNMADYLTWLLNVQEGSYLSDLEEVNTGVVFREALTDSVFYMVSSRLGLEVKLLPDDLFKDIFNFNTFETVMQLGGAASDISEMVLRQIERTVKDIERQERDRLAKSDYLNDNIIRDEERSGEHGDHIHTAGRLSDTRPDAGEPETRTLGKYGMLRKRSSRTTGKGHTREYCCRKKLDSHLAEIDQMAREQVKAAMTQMAQAQGVTEALKANDPMKWTGLMNMIKLQAEEVVLQNLIYS